MRGKVNVEAQSFEYELNEMEAFQLVCDQLSEFVLSFEFGQVGEGLHACKIAFF